MNVEVVLTDDAAQDLAGIYAYILDKNSPESAISILDNIESTVTNLAHFPLKGSYPRELLILGIKEYRQVFFKSYRIIYRVIKRQVIVFCIVDERRDMQTLLQHRLLSR